MYDIEFTIPDKNNKHNFVFDTYVIEKELVNDSSVVKKCQNKIKNGYHYYITNAQINEIHGRPVRKYKLEEYPEWTPSSNIQEVQKVIDVLCIERVSCVATNLPNFDILDGSFREFLDFSPEEPISVMLYEIYNNNLKHLLDAVIAEAAIHNNCLLVSTDIRPIKIVNKYFPERAFLYNDFLRLFLQ